MINTSLLDDFPHFKSEWKNVGSDNSSIYKNVYSSDLCQLKVIKSIPMKDLDLYSSRQAYCFPYCPRIYKYVLENNTYNDSQITFDIRLLAQKVPKRLSQKLISSEKQAIKGMAAKIEDITKGFAYLFNRFGPFHITEGMIGITELGVIKVWFNEDYCSNKISLPVKNEQIMVRQLIELLFYRQFSKDKNLKDYNSFASILKYFCQGCSTKKQQNHHVALKSIENFTTSFNQQRHKRREVNVMDNHSNRTRKNITFSYSNKDLSNKLIKRSDHKRNSIYFEDDVIGQPILKKQFTFAQNQQIASLKLIGKRTIKKQSLFNPSLEEKDCIKVSSQLTPRRQSQELKVKKLSQHFSKTTTYSSTHKEVPNIQQICQRFSIHKQKPQIMHYSTSSNPYNRIVNISQKCNDNYSNIENGNNSAIGDYQGQQRREDVQFISKGFNFEELQKDFQALQIDQRHQDMKSSQEVRNDLDALFNSDRQFDYNQLQNELDHVLF